MRTGKRLTKYKVEYRENDTREWHSEEGNYKEKMISRCVSLRRQGYEVHMFSRDKNGEWNKKF